MRVRDPVDDPGDQPAEDIEYREPHRTHAVLDVVAEDPERPHVPDDVSPAAMEKHAGQERPVVIDRETDPRGPLRMSVARRDDSEKEEQPFELSMGQSQLEAEDQDVQPDQRIDGQRWVATPDGVLDWDHR